MWSYTIWIPDFTSICADSARENEFRPEGMLWETRPFLRIYAAVAYRRLLCKIFELVRFSGLAHASASRSVAATTDLLLFEKIAICSTTLYMGVPNNPI